MKIEMKTDWWRVALILLVWLILGLWTQAHQPSFITYSDGGVWDGR